MAERALTRALIAAASLAAVACSGELRAPPSPAQGAGDTPRDEAPATPGDEGDEPALAQAGPLPLRLLTRTEYERTIEALFEVSELAETNAFPSEITGDSGFATVGRVSTLHVERYLQAAESIASAAAPVLQERYACEGPGDEAERRCAATFIEEFGLRAFRRPLGPQEVSEYEALYEEARSGELALAHQGALGLLVEAMLQSPFFLYHWERDERGAAPEWDEGAPERRLSGWEIASRLSYFLWRSMPDEELFRAAASGELEDRAEVARQARRLLDDPRAREVVADFFFELLHLDRVLEQAKHSGLFPDYDAQARRSMVRSARAFIEEVVFASSGGFGELLTAPWAFVDASLAPIYGVDAPEGDAMVRVELDPARRAGLLTLPALLSAHSDATEGNPIFRGLMVRELFLCDQIPPPSGDVPPLPTGEGGATLRERVTHHTSPAQCQGCHTLINEPGFAFGHYDAVGAWIETEHGEPIDPTGALRIGADSIPFDGAAALAGALAERPEAHRCFADHLSRFALGRARHPSEASSADSIERAFADSGLDVRALLIAVATSHSFLYEGAPTEASE